MAEKSFDQMLIIVNNILKRCLVPGNLEVAVGDEHKEAFYLESMESLVTVIGGRARVKKEIRSELDHIKVEIIEAIKSFHQHHIPETIKHLKQSRVLVLELIVELKKQSTEEILEFKRKAA